MDDSIHTFYPYTGNQVTDSVAKLVERRGRWLDGTCKNTRPGSLQSMAVYWCPTYKIKKGNKLLVIHYIINKPE